jgi:serine kinase of HPr protein (carbohydrate metabolism regulator)
LKPHLATCVAIGRRGVLIEGPPGSGKSTLALSLIDRGAQLVGDDGVMIATDNGRLVAHSHLRTQGLLEIRNLGILPFPSRDNVTIALMIMLDADAPRYIEEPSMVERGGVRLPALAIWPGSSALKVEHALRVYGLPE